jgi:alpha-beta hydrolase superfamily lysophospholipase
LNDLIPYDDFGGSGPFLHFAHSNGYTPGCFRQMLQPLTADYHVTGIRLRPLWPGSEPQELESWDVIAGDVREFFAQQGYHPDLFRALVLIEPVFLPPDILNMIAAQPELAEKMPLLPVTRRRRTHWSDRQSAFDHFRQKTVFERWSDDAIWDYVNYGLHETNQGEVTLTYSREWEARFYAIPPLRVWQDIPKVTQPTLAIRGADSDTLFPQSWQLWQELQPQATFIEIPDAGHMVTMERPQLLSAEIRKFLTMEQ